MLQSPRGAARNGLDSGRILIDSVADGVGSARVERVAILLRDLSGGGAERVTVNLANELAARGYHVDLVLFRPTGPLLAIIDPVVNVVDLGVSRYRWSLWPLIRYLRMSNPSALLACMWPMTVLAVLAKAVARIDSRLLVVEHKTWSADLATKPWRRRMVSASMRLVFPHADARIAVSEGAADDLARFSGVLRSSISVLYNPVVDGSVLAPEGDGFPPDSWWSGNHRRILAVGRLVKEKDLPTLLRAFSHMRNTGHPCARLLMLGEGEDRHMLEALVGELGVADAVDMPGFVADTRPYFRRADLFVLSSATEGLPTVVIEAMAAGARIVSTDCPSGPRELLQDGALGRLVPVGDVAGLAQAMVSALRDDPDREALRSRAADFSVSRCVDDYERLLLGRRASS